eukprot:gene7989-biopygen290
MPHRLAASFHDDRKGRCRVVLSAPRRHMESSPRRVPRLLPRSTQKRPQRLRAGRSWTTSANSTHRRGRGLDLEEPRALPDGLVQLPLQLLPRLVLREGEVVEAGAGLREAQGVPVELADGEEERPQPLHPGL